MNIYSIPSTNTISFKQKSAAKTVETIVQEARQNIKHPDAEECIKWCTHSNTDACTDFAVPRLLEIAIIENPNLKRPIKKFFTDLFNSQEINEDPASSVLLKTFKNALDVLA